MSLYYVYNKSINSVLVANSYDYISDFRIIRELIDSRVWCIEHKIMYIDDNIEMSLCYNFLTDRYSWNIPYPVANLHRGRHNIKEKYNCIYSESNYTPNNTTSDLCVKLINQSAANPRDHKNVNTYNSTVIFVEQYIHPLSSYISVTILDLDDLIYYMSRTELASLDFFLTKQQIKLL